MHIQCQRKMAQKVTRDWSFHHFQEAMINFRFRWMSQHNATYLIHSSMKNFIRKKSLQENAQKIGSFLQIRVMIKNLQTRTWTFGITAYRFPQKNRHIALTIDVIMSTSLISTKEATL